MKPLVIYHADCTDGFAAAFAAWLKLGDKAEYLPWQYNEKVMGVDLADMVDREVYILDFSFPRETMDWLFANAKRVVWLDHHKTAFEMWCGGIPKNNVHMDVSYPEDERKRFICLHNGKSGALLTWEFFYPGIEAPMFIRHIDDRDRWQFKFDGSKELHAYLASIKPWTFEQWWDECRMLNNFGDDYELNDFALLERAKKQGGAILRAQDAHVKSMVKQARKCFIPDHGDMAIGFPGLALNTPMHISEVGHELANTSGTFGLVWYLGNDNRARCSLRSNGDYDVSAIARSFGGGGHRNAAGFETDIETLVGWLR